MKLKKSVARYINSQLMFERRYYDTEYCVWCTTYLPVMPAPGRKSELWMAAYDDWDSDHIEYLKDFKTLTIWYPPTLLHPFDCDWCPTSE